MMSAIVRAGYRYVVRPALFKRDPELMHHAALHALGLLQCVPELCNEVCGMLTVQDSRLVQEWEGVRFPNPVGVPAGVDKAGVVVPALAALGFGSVEIGTVPRDAQPGKPFPRMFRLELDEAVINRMGFNSPGAAAVAAQLKQMRPLGVPLIINIGMSMRVDASDREAVEGDYRATVHLVHPFADIVTINVSSPNTPGIRSLQRREPMIRLVNCIVAELVGRRAKPIPILVKIAPDLMDEEILDVVEVIRIFRSDGVKIGLIATNTTLRRDGLRSSHRDQVGGLSGRPLTNRAQRVAEIIRRELPDVFLVGVGGIMTVEDAIERLRVANVIQVYTGLVYHGPTFAHDLNMGVLRHMRRYGFTTLAEMRQGVAL